MDEVQKEAGQELHIRVEVYVDPERVYIRVDHVMVLRQARLLLDAPLDLEQEIRLPVVQLHNLVKFVYGPRECFRLPSINRTNQDVDELRFSRRYK